VSQSSFSATPAPVFRVPTGASVDGLTVTDSHFDGNAFGFETYMGLGSDGVRNVSIMHLDLQQHTFKGLYAEKTERCDPAMRWRSPTAGPPAGSPPASTSTSNTPPIRISGSSIRRSAIAAPVTW
jgi:hypothetical protein